MAQQCLQLRQSFAGTQLAAPQLAASSACTLKCPTRMAQSLQGKVVSTKSSKTAVVAVETFVPHYLYKKRIRKTTRFQAHDEEEKCTVGDYVVINPSKPISKSKRFIVGETLRKSDL